MPNTSTLAAALASALVVTAATAGQVEVLHYWTSGGEAKSVAELKRMMEAKGHVWKDFAVAGGGGDNAATVLKSRVVSGNAPAAARVPEIWVSQARAPGRCKPPPPPRPRAGVSGQGAAVPAPAAVRRPVQWCKEPPTMVRAAASAAIREWPHHPPQTCELSLEW